MEIHEIKDADVVVLAPDSSISDSEEISALEVKLGTALKAGGRLVVFDCAAAGQLTSSALRVLLLASRKLDRTEGRLVLCGMNSASAASQRSGAEETGAEGDGAGSPRGPRTGRPGGADRAGGADRSGRAGGPGRPDRSSPPGGGCTIGQRL